MSAVISNLVDFWNDASVHYDGIKMTITDVNSQANSALITFTVNDVDTFVVDKSGNIVNGTIPNESVLGLAAALDELQNTVEEARDLAALYGSARIYETWTELSAVTGNANSAAIITSDPGTHTDPVNANTVNNSGLYKWNVTPSGWKWLDNTVAFNAYESALAANTAAVAATSSASVSASILSLIQSLVTSNRFYFSTIADGVAATPVGGMFTSDEGGSWAFYKRTDTSPFYSLYKYVITEDYINSSIVGGANVYETWLALGTTPAANGVVGVVLTNDSGTHTDPIMANTVNNSGVFVRYPAGWKRIANTEAYDAYRSSVAANTYMNITNAAAITAVAAANTAVFAYQAVQSIALAEKLYYPYIANGVADTANGYIFSSDEGGVWNYYKKTTTSPFYEYHSQVNIPRTQTLFEFTSANNQNTFVTLTPLANADVEVFANGFRLQSSDFTVAGNSVVLSTNRANNDSVAVVVKDNVIVPNVTAAAVTYMETETGAASQNILTALRNKGMISPQDYKARGPGYDDTGPMQDWLNAVVNRKGGYLLPMNYTISSMLNPSLQDMTGVKIMGFQGSSYITGSNGIGAKMLELGNVQGLLIDGVGFINQHVLSYSSLESFKGIVHLQNKNAYNLTISNCSFTAANSVQHCIFLASATSHTGITPSYIRNVKILNNTFENVGGQGITFMNRTYLDSNPYQYFQNVFVNGNRAKTLGIAQAYPGGGQFISLDGYGKRFEISYNELIDLWSQGIENTGWQDGTVHDNTGENFTRGWALLTYSGRGAGDPADTKHPLSNTHSFRNKIYGSSVGSLPCTYAAMDSTCSVEEDYIVANHNTYAVNFRENIALKVRSSQFINANTSAASAINVDSYQLGNQKIDFVDCVADAAASTTGTNVIQFAGSGTTQNYFRGPRASIRKGSAGGYVGQGSSAIGNVVEPFIDESGNKRNGVLTLSASSDGDQTITGGTAAQAFDILIFSGGVAWTAERSLDFNSIEIFREPRLFRHSKEWPCTIKINGTLVASSRINPNQTVVLQANSSGTLIVTPYTAGLLTGSATFDAPNLAAGSTTTTTVTVNGAALGDFADASLGVSTAGLVVTANVTNTNVVTVTIYNPTTGSIDLSSTTIKARVWK